MNRIADILEIREMATEIARVSRCPGTVKKARRIVEITEELVPMVRVDDERSEPLSMALPPATEPSSKRVLFVPFNTRAFGRV